LAICCSPVERALDGGALGEKLDVRVACADGPLDVGSGITNAPPLDRSLPSGLGSPRR